MAIDLYIQPTLCLKNVHFQGIFYFRRPADKTMELGAQLGVPAGVRGPHSLCHADRNQSQGQQYIRERQSRYYRQSKSQVMANHFLN